MAVKNAENSISFICQVKHKKLQIQCIYSLHATGLNDWTYTHKDAILYY